MTTFMTFALVITALLLFIKLTRDSLTNKPVEEKFEDIEKNIFNQSKFLDKKIEEHFEDTLTVEDFVSNKHLAEVNDHVKEIMGCKMPKKYLEKSKRKSSTKVVKDK